MEFPRQMTISLSEEGIKDVPPRHVTIYGGITTFVGPNGSGKTQLMKGLKRHISTAIDKQVRYVSSGRLGPLEQYRSDFDGRRGGLPDYDNATYGNLKSMARRHKAETVLGDFASLSERPDILVKVQERLRQLFLRHIRLVWDGGNLQIFFERADVTAQEYSSAREASGLLNLVATLSALYDDEVGCLLIDEPEVSLHHQLQSFLYQEMLKVAGDPDVDRKKLIIISTHSTAFIHLQTVDDLASIVFCSDVYEAPVQVDPSIEEFKNRKIMTLLSRMGQDYKLSLFCKRPLIVEGMSDQIICSAINRRLDLNAEASGSHILPVTGKGQMPTVIKLMRILGKTPVVLADADGLADGLGLASSFTSLDEANAAAAGMGHRNAFEFARSIYNDFAQLVEKHWDDVADLAMRHAYWTNRGHGDESLAKKRAVLSILLDLAPDSIMEVNNSEKWNQIQDRLKSLLRLLNSAGCFILTKGTIEDYYIHEESVDLDDKRNLAAHEVSYLSETDDEHIRQRYADIVSAIEFAAETREINEGTAVRDIALAVVTPVLANISSKMSPGQLKAQSKNIVGKQSTLFDLKIEDLNGLHLVVDLSTSILDVEGFPLRIPEGANTIVSVNKQMKLD